MSAKRPALVKLAQKWRNRLGLGHWHITIGYRAPQEMESQDTIGEVTWNGIRRTASIRVLDPKYFTDATTAQERDVEFTVVHELVHAVIGSVLASDVDYMRKENVIDDLTSALIKADRGQA